MTVNPPYLLSGQAGKSLDVSGYSLEALNILDGSLTQASLAPDTLVFSQRAKAGAPVPDDGQWLTLRDVTGEILFTGVCKRTFQYPQMIYRFTASSVYQGLADTNLTDNAGRAYLSYPTGNLWDVVRDILLRAQSAGLPIQPPDADEMPDFYAVPKTTCRGSSYATALEDALKWAPDVTTRMDYGTTPPTLRFFCRGTTIPTTIQLDSDSNRSAAVALTPYQETRALGITFSYSRRGTGANIIQMTQSAGDMTAEAHRKLSLFLTGIERSDLLSTEALTTAQTAVAMATALGAVSAAANTLPLSWSTCVARDSALAAAVTAEPAFVMAEGGLNYVLYSSCTWQGGTSYATIYSGQIGGLYLSESNGVYAGGWYPVPSNAFTDAQLTTAGATKATKYIRGNLILTRYWSSGYSAGLNAIAGSCSQLSGFLSDHAGSEAYAEASYRDYRIYPVNISVDAVNMAPSAIKAAVDGAAAAATMVTRADFVDVPTDLAANFFARQDWTPYKGTIRLTPSASIIPVPGEFVCVNGASVPPDWVTMAAPIATTEIDLRANSSVITLGPSPRMDYTSIADRLRIQPEDNYQPG